MAIKINIREFNAQLNEKRHVDRGGFIVVQCPGDATRMRVHPDAVDEETGEWAVDNPPFCDICVPLEW
jgi:hypothetical protein